MRIGLLGEAKSLCDDLDAAGIEWEEFEFKPRPGRVMAAAGPIIEITIGAGAVFWLALASVLRAWVATKSSRDVMVVTEQQRIVHIKGMSVEDVERILKTALHVDALDTGKPERKKLDSE